MKIAIFTDTFYPGVGGTENAVIGLATALSKDNEVVVCAPRPKKAYDDSQFSFKVLRTKSVKLPQDDECYGFPAISISFQKQLNAFSPDIIHCQTVNSLTTYGIEYAHKHNIPVVMTIHTKFKMIFERNTKSKVIINALLKMIAKKANHCNAVYAVSNDLASEIKGYGTQKPIKVIRNGATFNRIEDMSGKDILARKTYNLYNQPNILLFVGHIVKFKNLQFLIDALCIVKQRNVPFKMLFVGHGLDSQYFKKYVIKRGLAQQVIFTDQITDKEMLSSLYAVSEVMLFPSIFDNDSLAIVEASLHRVPTIALENTGSSERLVDGISGFVVKNDVNAYADKIIEVLSDKQKLADVGAKAERMIPKTWQQTASEYMQEYCGLVEQQRQNNIKNKHK